MNGELSCSSEEAPLANAFFDCQGTIHLLRDGNQEGFSSCSSVQLEMASFSRVNVSVSYPFGNGGAWLIKRIIVARTNVSSY